MTKLSQEQVDQIAELREKGYSYRRLAEKFGVSTGAIHYRCLRVGALSPRSLPIDYPARRATGYGFGKVVRHFSPEDDRRLLDLEREGASLNQMVEQLGRARTTVRIRLLTLAAKEGLA